MHHFTYHLVSRDSSVPLADAGEHGPVLTIQIPYVHAVPAVWRSSVDLAHVTLIAMVLIALIGVPLGVLTWRQYRGRSKRWARSIAAAIGGGLFIPTLVAAVSLIGTYSSPLPSWLPFVTAQQIEAPPSRGDVLDMREGWFSAPLSDAEWVHVDQAGLDRSVRTSVARRYGLQILSAGPLLSQGSVVVTGRGTTQRCTLQVIGRSLDSTGRVASQDLVLLCGNLEPQLINDLGGSRGDTEHMNIQRNH